MIDSALVLQEMFELEEDGFRSDALMRHAVKSLATDDRFSWIGVYILDEEKNELWLHNYVGPSTDHVRIPVGQGVCGTAVAEGANQNVPDVQAIENYLSCSPAVRSELVVLIRSGDQIFGQIDIDSEEVGTFTTEDESNIQEIADAIGAWISSERS